MSEKDLMTQYNRDGYYVARGLFSAEEVEKFKTHYHTMLERESAAQNKSLSDVAEMKDNDPLRKYPRLMQMHRRDKLSMDWMLDARINKHITLLMGGEPYAVQTMHYFKPPGARGQALHQDQYYLRVQPGTCMAAWLALDDCDEANGCLMVVPGSHIWPLLCLTEADTSKSFTDVTVPLPEGVHAKPVIMKAGDMLFFNGQIVHGSEPNTTANRFRRSLIGHYISGDANEVNKWYFPAFRMDGSVIELDVSEIGGSCGNWVNHEGREELELVPEIRNVKIFGPH